MKQNTKKYLKLSIILYIVILSVALIGTLAWFTFEKSATIGTEDKSKIVAGEYLEICFDDGNDDPSDDVWVTEMGMLDVAQIPDVSVTPDGTVWYPVSLDEGEQLFVGEQGNGVYRNVTDQNGYYIRLNLKVRASRGLDVYLHNTSRVEGINMDKTDASGTFSKDAVAGAARVGFFGENGVKKIWVPNEKYELILNDGKVEGFAQDGDAESEYKYLKVVNDTVIADDEYGKWEDNQLLIGAKGLAGDTTIEDAKPILSFGDAGEQKLTVYIWVEGSDREANTVLSGGSIKYNLKFVGINTKALSSVNIEDVTYSGGKLVYASSGAEVGSEILYSRDAKQWTPYSTGAPLVTEDEGEGESEPKILYVRARETATEMVGAIKEISVK